MNAPTVGIVIPAYNVEKYLAATLDAILAQTLTDWYCVIVDDGSTDGTAALADRYAATDARFKMLRQSNAGPCVARNLGYKALPAATKYVTFMDADDVWTAEALAILHGESEAHPEAVGAHGLGDFIDAEGNPLSPGEFANLGRGRIGCDGGRPTPWPLDRPTEFSTVFTASVMFPPGLMIARKEIYDRVGPFDEAMRYAEDWDMLIRVCRYGPVRFVDRVILGYRRHGANVGTGTKVPEACSRVRAKAYYSMENTAEHRRIVRDSWRASQRIIANKRLKEAKEAWVGGRAVRAAATAARLIVIGYRFMIGGPSAMSKNGRAARCAVGTAV